MDNCPIDILENILFRLPFRATLQATKVCKTWKTLLANSNRCCNEEGFLVSYHICENNDVQLYYGEQYGHAHGDIDHGTKMMNYYYGRFFQKFAWGDPVIGSCNGLVCLRQHNQRSEIQYLVCNPLTGEYVFVPQIDYTCLPDSDWDTSSDGFGYCYSTNKYTVVRIYYNRSNVGNVLVYTVGTHEWRNIGTTHHKLAMIPGIFVNGVLHWLSYDIREAKVFGFNLKDEKLQLLPMPPYHFQFYKRQLKLLGGNLCFVHRSACCFPQSIRRYPCIEIWAYKRNSNNMKAHDQKHDYYDKNSWNWIKEFYIESWEDFEPFAVTRSNQLLLWNRLNCLYSYDPEASTLTELWGIIMDDGMRPSRIKSIPYTNSFVSLKDLGESDATIFNSCKKEDYNL